MALTDASKVAIALKKVQGKSQTKTENELYNEQFTSGLSLASKTIFAATPSNNPNTALNSVTDSTVEKVRFVVEYISGTDTSDGKHAFKLKLPSDYEANSSNPNKATGSYIDDAELVTSAGRLQLVSPQFGNAYIAKAYYGSIGSLTEIPLADPRDWVLDYFNGVFFQEDPPTDVTHNPTYVEAYLYIGEYLDQRLQAHEGASSELATGFDKYVKRVTATTAALTNVTFTGLNTTDVPNDASLRVFLNGDLLLEGNQTTTTAYSNADPRIPSATNTHFYISGTSTLQFGFALQDGDYVVVEKHSFMGDLNPRHGLVVDSSGSEYIIDVEYSGATTSVIKSATDGTGVTVDDANDFLLLHDATDNVVKYIKPNQLPSGDITSVAAGTGLDGGGLAGALTLNVDYAGADSVIKSATNGTAITIDNDNDFLLVHDATDDTVKYVKASQVGGGQAGVIGAAEDGDYTDGLFTSFSPTTPTGTAIDRFNEILKLLAPSPAPDVSRINSSTSNGIGARLSFGASNTGAPTYANSGTDAGFAAVDTNSVYQSATNGNNFRLGVYTSATVIEGIVNFHVAQDQYANNVVNHVADTFGNAELGDLKLYVNGNLVHTTDLTDNATGNGVPGGTGSNDLSSNSGFIDISAKKGATSEGGTLFDIFQHRTASYRVGTAAQREGWNYARVVHSHSGNEYETNYVEWIIDTSTAAISTASTSISNFAGSDEFVLSGIKYFKTASFDYSTTISNAFRAIHTTTPITFNPQYGSVTAATDQNSVNLLTTFPSVESGEDFTKSIVVSASSSFNVTQSGTKLNGTATIDIDVVHPKGAKSGNGIGAATLSGLLMWYPSSSSTEHELEDFNNETYRQQAGNYATQADVYTSSAYVTPWDSSIKVDSADAGHNTGLVLYQGELRAPRNTLLNGDFASITNGPSSNADYSGITTGTRSYIRSFKKTSAGSVRDIRLTMRGSGTIIANGTSFGSANNNFKVYIKIPGTTGWMDLATPFVLGSTNDNDGARIHTWTPNLSTSQDRNNYASFGLSTISQNEYILVKIEADASWTGNISKMVMRFGASTGAESSVPDSCTSINSTTSDGVDGKLSFGASQSIPNSDANQPYENVAGANSLASVNINNEYTVGSNRKGIYDGTAILTGIVNSGEAGDSGNFVANAIRYGNAGIIKIIVNNVEKHSVNLATYTGTGNPGSGVAQNINGAGTGFSNISTAQYVTWSDGIPDYRYNVRTMHWRVAAADQRSGHNWVRIVHSVDGTDHETNYMEWVNDPNNDALTVSNIDLANFTDSDISQLSGIKYFNSPSTTMKFRVENGYRNIYSGLSQAIGFTSLSNMDLTNLEITGAGVTDPNDVSTDKTLLPPVITSSDTAYTLPLDVTGSFNYTVSTNLPGTHGTSQFNPSAAPFVVHPLKNVSPAAASKTGMLVWTPTQSGSSNNHTIEDFSAEDYRLEDQAFPASTSTTTNVDGATWDSTQSLVGADAQHNTGLCVYNGKLIAPSKAGNSGDFVTNLQGPAGNVDYSGATTGATTRTYLRKYHKTTAGDAATSFVLSLTGTGKLVSEGGNKAFPKNQETLTNDAANFHIKVKYIYHSTQSPGTKNTGWLDAGEASNLGAADGDACQDSADNQTALNKQWNNSTNTVSIRIPQNRELLGTTNGNYVIIKIEASENWTGHFSDMRITSMT